MCAGSEFQVNGAEAAWRSSQRICVGRMQGSRLKVAGDYWLVWTGKGDGRCEVFSRWLSNTIANGQPVKIVTNVWWTDGNVKWNMDLVFDSVLMLCSQTEQILFEHLKGRHHQSCRIFETLVQCRLQQNHTRYILSCCIPYSSISQSSRQVSPYAMAHQSQ